MVVFWEATLGRGRICHTHTLESVCRIPGIPLQGLATKLTWRSSVSTRRTEGAASPSTEPSARPYWLGNGRLLNTQRINQKLLKPSLGLSESGRSAHALRPWPQQPDLAPHLGPAKGRQGPANLGELLGEKPMSHSPSWSSTIDMTSFDLQKTGEAAAGVALRGGSVVLKGRMHDPYNFLVGLSS